VRRVAVVHASAGADVTDAFMRGAEVALDVVRRHAIRVAVLKEGSPSCASSFVYDGTFSGARTRGQGVTAALLQANGVRVFSEDALDGAAAFVAQLEQRS